MPLQCWAMSVANGKAETMSTTETRESGAKTQRAWKHHVRSLPRSLTPPKGLAPAYAGLFSRCVAWVLPWSMSDYPGIQRGAAELLGGAAGRWAIRSWRRGARPMPDWAARMLADYLRRRIEAGQALVAELEAYRAPERQRSGVCRVDPVTGRDGRNRTGNGRRTKP